jgi:4-diphosphocytidyl-2-C-methyl-D-erythritol kinase
MPHSIRIPAFAKVNLCLRVLHRRADNFHELRTIFQTISLHDTLSLTRIPARRVVLETNLEINGPSIPGGPQNLIWQAVEKCRRRWKLTGGVHVRLEKRIPVGAGLGGGSSDAAAAIIGMLRLAKLRVPLASLMELAAGLGSDVPFFLFGGRALGAGRGEEVYPLPEIPKKYLLLVSPHDLAVSTAEAYRWLSPSLTKAGIPSKIYQFRTLCWSPRKTGLPNDFQRPVFQRYPRLKTIQRELLRHGAVEAALAGSGSTVFGIFRSPAQARRTARLFPDDHTYCIETLTREECARARRWHAVAG